MTYPDLARHLIRIFSENDRMKAAHIALVTSEFSSIRNTWKGIYHYCTGKQLFEKIEQLPPDQKKELWETTRELCEGKELTKDQLIDACRAFYTIEYFLNENT